MPIEIARCVDPFVGPAGAFRGLGTQFALCDFPGWRWGTTATGPMSKQRGGFENAMIRYGFTIRTRTGQRIENVSIIAGSQSDAERRLRQMYMQCEILECRERSIPRRFEAANLATMIDLRAISPPTIQHHG
ncbi:MAG TPA: hypothetical protein VF059_13270 [Casimicrobiaceae bacterium]